MHEWWVIQHAQGYGRSWAAWLLGFECIACVPCALPTAEWLLDAYQVTKCDADAYAQQELQLRKHHKRHSLVFAQSHTNNSSAYRFIKGKEQKFLTDIPVCLSSPASLCRASHNLPKIRLQQPFDVPVGSTVRFGSCSATVYQTQMPYVTITNLQGPLPGSAEFVYHTHACTCEDMSPHFHHFWSQFWLRDSFQSQLQDDTWQTVHDDITHAIPQQPHIDIRIDDPQCLIRNQFGDLSPIVQQALTGGTRKSYNALPRQWLPISRSSSLKCGRMASRTTLCRHGHSILPSVKSQKVFLTVDPSRFWVTLLDSAPNLCQTKSSSIGPPVGRQR